MSSELFMFDNSFFSDPFSPFTDSTIEILQEIQENKVPNYEELDQIASVLLSSPSPPRIQLQSLSLSQFADYSVKTEEPHLNSDTFCSFANSFSPHSFDQTKLMQRSFSSNSFGHKQDFAFRPRFDVVSESPSQILTSPPQNNFAQIRRVCSTGDLQSMKMKMQTRNVLSSSPLAADKSVIEEANFKVGRYSAQERKERIDRYRAKRTHRNFNKTIKYTCRKTLADTRPRIRGRFARNDEAGEMPKASTSQRYEDDVWVDGFHDEEDEGIATRRPFFNMSGSTQYHNFSYS